MIVIEKSFKIFLLLHTFLEAQVDDNGFDAR